MPPPIPPQSLLAIPRDEAERRFSGAYADARTLNDVLAEARALHAHLLSPAPVCASIPEGFEVVLCPLWVDVAMETYPTDGPGGGAKNSREELRGLSKPALDKLGRALGISWDPKECRRVDTESVLHYWRYRAGGSYLDFDGRLIVISPQEAEIDVRGEDSADVVIIRERAKHKLADRDYRGKPPNPEAEIRELRRKGGAKCETLARLRAIRALGIRHAYRREELDLPFVAVRVVPTARNVRDPALARQFATTLFEQAVGAKAALYGPAPSGERLGLEPERRLRVAVEEPPEPPPRPKERQDQARCDPGGPPVAKCATPSPAAAPPPARGPAPEARRGAPIEGADELRLPFTREKGVLLRDASDDCLRSVLRRVRDDFDNGSSYNPERDWEMGEAIQAELDRRERRR